MIRSDLCYAMQAGRPLLIDPRKVKSFLANANALLSNPDLAYMLSQYATPEKYKSKANDTRADFPNIPEHPEKVSDVENAVAQSVTPYVEDGIGIIPVKGVIGKGLTKLEELLGCADIDVINRTLDEWADREDVYEVLFKVDSGGGSTTGLEECAKKIRNYKKPTIAFSDSDCGSAAFWMASQCRRLVVTPSSSIGACGVYITMADESEKWAKEGKNQVVIKSGDYKAAGVEGTSLTKKQMANLQEEVDELHRRFIRDVLSVRMFAKVEDLQGQSFYGDIASQRGLATGVVDTFEELLKDIKSLRAFARTSTLPNLYSNQNTGFTPLSGGAIG